MEVPSGYAQLHVLLVDDNPSMRKIATAVLKGAGVGNVEQAADGRGALSVLRQRAIDIIVVDFSMKPMDGVAFTRTLRSDLSNSNRCAPIIMMTGHSERSRVIEARDAGVNEFVAKPISAKALLDRFHAVIHRPRVFVSCETYCGPDRRRGPSRIYEGPRRRESDKKSGPEA